MRIVHKEAGLADKNIRAKRERKTKEPRFTESDELTALQGKDLFPEKLEEAKAFFKGVH